MQRYIGKSPCLIKSGTLVREGAHTGVGSRPYVLRELVERARANHEARPTKAVDRKTLALVDRLQAKLSKNR